MGNNDEAAVQAEEMEALFAIYGDDLVDEGCNVEQCRVYSMKIRHEINNVELILFLKLPPTYPTASPPMFEISCGHLDGTAKNVLSERLQEIYMENIGQPILYLWFEASRQFLEEWYSRESPNVVASVAILDEQVLEDETQQAEPNCGSCIDPSAIQSGDPLTDRKSTFQAHLAPVLTKDDVQYVLGYLKKNAKIARATHNMFAYRIHDGRICIQDCEDDGENQAGSRLLHLLEIMDARNVLVVVSRWYGGTHLGPDRFKHINNVTRDILEKNGYGKQQQQSGKETKKGEKKSKP